MDLSIIVVNRNGTELLNQTLKSVLDTELDMDYEIIVVDDASTDKSFRMVEEHFPHVFIIENEHEAGFSKSVNLGIKESSGKYVLLLGLGTAVSGVHILKCLNYMRPYENIGALGCKIKFPDGKLNDECRLKFKMPDDFIKYILKINRDVSSGLPQDKISEVDCISKDFMLIRRETINTVGVIDEKFSLYGADIDWCLRMRWAGWNVVYYPECEAVDYGNHERKKSGKVKAELGKASVLLFNKHYKYHYNMFMRFFIKMAVRARSFI